MESVILDSSSVIALFNSSDIHHRAIVAAISGTSATFSISAMTATETLVAPSKISSRQLEVVLGALSESFGDFHPIDTEIAVKAAGIRAATGIATPDAIISATALARGFSLWTCDKRLAKIHKGARLIALR